MEKGLKNDEVWFVTGSQHLYGHETLKIVDEHSKEIVADIDGDNYILAKIICKPVLTTPEDITRTCLEANNNDNCIGIITWMHTFSPAKMWISGLKQLRKPFVHLHTQFNRDIPWNEIDMDFMNLNQSAHGGREFGFINSRMRINRKIIVGHWKDEAVRKELSVWIQAAAAWADWQGAKIARFGDNMREVAVTEGDKVAAQVQFGFNVYGYGVGDLVNKVEKVPEREISQLLKEYQETYTVSSALLDDPAKMAALAEAARIELGMLTFLREGNFKAFTTTFEDLNGLAQLPGLAVQRLMEKGYGFGAEGDWKTAALVRAGKIMALGLEGGTSFMEDYTYHLEPGNMQVLGAHMLEVCPSIANDKPSLEIHPLSIGGKDDPARLVFAAKTGPGINASLMDMGNRFRLIVNKVMVLPSPELPNLPVARVLWEPMPGLKTAAGCWIMAGGAHHTCFSMAIDDKYMEDFANIAGIEYLLIDKKTDASSFQKEMNWNEMYYLLAKSLYK